MIKILTRDEFLDQPENTVFAECDAGANIGPLGIKMKSAGDTEYWLQELTQTKGNEIAYFENSDGSFKDVELDLDCLYRDGTFEEDQLFMVFDKKDIKTLIQRLQDCL